VTRSVAGGVDQCRLLDFPRIHDPRGNLTFVEAQRHVPFEIRRAYWTYAVPGGERRGGHAYRELDEVVIALSGSFHVHVDDGTEARTHLLNRGYTGLYVPNLIWRELDIFSTNAVCLVLASARYDPDDYVRDREEFLRLRGGAA
jgi:hypothetical protein